MSTRPLIFLDPGHGGHDAGRTGTIRNEKVLNLDLSITLRDLLPPEFDSQMTRTDDVFIRLMERCRIANEAGADLFISLHHNGFHIPSANGFEVLHFHTSIRGRRLAELIVSHYDPVSQLFGIRIRGVKPRDRLTVLKQTRMPAVIVEGGFLSNPDDERVVNGGDYQLALSQAIKNALAEYFGSGG